MDDSLKGRTRQRNKTGNDDEADAYERLRTEIAARHATLSDRLRNIAEFALENPTDMALGTVAEVAKRAGAQPSAIVRFAHTLGYGGFTEMQQVFRLRLVSSLAPSYKSRIDRLKRDGPWSGGEEPRAVLSRFVTEGIASLETLNAVAREPDLRRAIALLKSAETIYLLGLGGSYPVAAHLAYVLRKLGRRTVLLDAIGGGLREQAVSATRADALLAVSFKQYNADTVRLFAELIARGIRAVSITDNLLSPIARGAEVVFELHDMAEPALRTLVAPMSLAQTLAVGLGLSQD
ncbi:MAG: MurR/RpiR family transcriptional regulator [Reyranella sp.]|nr:MurR/RpiR family transcriptional regulator [Reyranella sp.]